MKEVFLILLLVLLFFVTGCSKNNGKKEEKLKDDEVILEKIKYKLDQDETGYGIKYKIASNFRKSEMINAINYFSENIDNRAYFVIRIFHYKNKSVEYAIKDTTTSYDKKWETKMDDSDYTAVHFVNPIGENVETKIYYHKSGKDVYAFCFTAAIDLSRLEEIFLKSVEY